MREILFRGKAPDDKWVEGFYYVATSGYAGSDEVIGKPLHMITTGRWEASGAYGERNELVEHTVIPESIGQYTGLTDKNGKKIFEGDIMPIWENGKEYNYKVVYNGDCFMLAMLDSEQGSYPLSVKCQISEVIGNIHDNPELLEAK